MPTIFSHAVAGAALVTVFPKVATPRLALAGAICAMVPDVDSIGFQFGVPYESLFGHRGFSHSLLFAAIVGLLATLLFLRGKSKTYWPLVLLYLFVATASHGLLDACTDGGLGIAFFSPFDTTRYFFPFDRIEVSPIGTGFFSHRGLLVMWSEIKWVWLPSIALAAVALTTRYFWSQKKQPTP